MDNDLQKRYAEWKARVSNQNYKGRKETHGQYMVKATRKYDPVYMEKVTANNRRKAKDPAYRKKLSEAAKNRTMPDTWYENLLKAKEKSRGIPSWNKGISPSEETKRKLREANLNKVISEETKKKIQQNAAKNKKIMTPAGEFISMSAAARYYYENKLSDMKSVGSTRVWIFKQCKKDPENYYYISQ